MRRGWPLLVAALALGGCGGHTAHRSVKPAPAVKSASAQVRAPRPRRVDPVALVTSERRNELIAVDVRTGRVLRRLRTPADPENVVAGRLAVLVSPAAHTVSVVDPRALRLVGRTRSFAFPHIPARSPIPGVAYVSDETAGTITPIRLTDAHVLPAVHVGLGAHHMAVSPDGRRLWVALGESASTIVLLDVSRPWRPRVIRRWQPGFSVHDLAFSPRGTEVWMSSAGGPDVVAVDARSLRVRMRIPVGAPPQHIAFAGSSAYLTSGYAGRIERVSVATGRVLARAATPYGSFELDAKGGYVMTASLLTGAVTSFTADLGRRWTETPGPATRDLAIVVPGASR